MSYVVIVGARGRMSLELQSSLARHKLDSRIFSPNASPENRVDDFMGSAGVIDFSTASLTAHICKMAAEAKVPLVVGTTGFGENREAIEKIFKKTAERIALVVDSNFSLGVELLCQSAAKSIAQILSADDGAQFEILDIHHRHKKDAPSGTALKIEKRILEYSPGAPVKIESVREGEVHGEHRVKMQFASESLEFIHRAHSRTPFADGAVSALQWAQNQSPGLYSMREIFESTGSEFTKKGSS